MTGAPNLDDTSRCPLGARCEACGGEGGDLAVTAAETLLGVLCWTLCGRCAGSDVGPRISVITASKLTLEHCAHLGIDPDAMAAALAAESLDRRGTQ
jgi:hypothetical protein